MNPYSDPKQGYYIHKKDKGLIFVGGSDGFVARYYPINDKGEIDYNLKADYPHGYIHKYYTLLTDKEFKTEMIKRTLKK